MQVLHAEVVFPTQSSLGEGSLWDADKQVLYWVDIHQHKVFLFDPERRANLGYDVGTSVGTVVPASNGTLVVALRHQIARLDLKTGQLSELVAFDLPQGVRLNDGKCDPTGRFWVGSMVEQGRPGSGGLYCIEPSLECSKRLGGLSISNGLCWYGEHFFHIDTPSHQLCSYRYQKHAGSISFERTVCTFPVGEGAPDGMCVDEQGMLWVALWGGGSVVRIDPNSGKIVLKVQVPASNVTSCALGGQQLDELYITTARAGLSQEELQQQPLAGSLFRVCVPARGVPAPAFAG